MTVIVRDLIWTPPFEKGSPESSSKEPASVKATAGEGRIFPHYKKKHDTKTNFSFHNPTLLLLYSVFPNLARQTT